MPPHGPTSLPQRENAQTDAPPPLLLLVCACMRCEMFALHGVKRGKQHARPIPSAQKLPSLEYKRESPEKAIFSNSRCMRLTKMPSTLALSCIVLSSEQGRHWTAQQQRSASGGSLRSGSVRVPCRRSPHERTRRYGLVIGTVDRAVW